MTSFLNNVPELKTSIQIKLLEHLSRCSGGCKRQTINKLAQADLNSSRSFPTKTSNIPMTENMFTNSVRLDQSKEAEHGYNNTISSENKCIFKHQETVDPNFNRTDTNNQSSIKPGLHHCGEGLFNMGENCWLNDSSCLPKGNIINGLQLIPAGLQTQETAYIIPTNINSNTCGPRVVFAMLTSTTPEIVNTNSGPMTNINNATCNSLSDSIKQEQDNTNRNSSFSKKETSTIYHTGDACKSNMNSNKTFISNREVQDPMWRPW